MTNNVELERLRVSLLYRQNVLTQAMGLLNAAIFFYVSAALVPRTKLFVWSALVLLIFLGRLTLHRYFRVHYLDTPQPFEPRYWENLFTLGTLASGLTWGATGWFLLPDAITHKAFLGFLLAGTTAGAAVAYCTSLRAMQAFFLGSVLPYAARLALGGTRFELAMAALTVCYVLLFSNLTLRMNGYVVDSLRLQFEKDGLLRELRRTQASVTYAAKMAALGEMAGGIAHEVNNPLTIIRSNIQILRDQIEQGCDTPKNSIKMANKIDATVGRIAGIVSGLRAFAREGDKDPCVPVAVKKIVEDTLDLCRERFRHHGVALEWASAPSESVVACREVEISQVLLNLLNNAFDATADGADPWVRLECVDRGEMVDIAVTDNGRGVPADLREKIMQPFFTTKPVGKGTGLGLSIATGIMSAHRGALTLDPASERTRFIVSIPRVSHEESAITTGMRQPAALERSLLKS